MYGVRARYDTHTYCTRYDTHTYDTHRHGGGGEGKGGGSEGEGGEGEGGEGDGGGEGGVGGDVEGGVEGGGEVGGGVNSGYDTVYPVEKILARRVRGRKLQFKVRWAGFGDKDDTWEDEESILDKTLITAFEEDGVICEVCLTGDTADDDAMLLCDGKFASGKQCEYGLHLKCSKLSAPPAGSWLCESCRQRSAECARATAPHRRRNRSANASGPRAKPSPLLSPSPLQPLPSPSVQPSSSAEARKAEAEARMAEAEARKAEAEARKAEAEARKAELEAVVLAAEAEARKAEAHARVRAAEMAVEAAAETAAPLAAQTPAESAAASVAAASAASVAASGAAEVAVQSAAPAGVLSAARSAPRTKPVFAPGTLLYGAGRTNNPEPYLTEFDVHVVKGYDEVDRVYTLVAQHIEDDNVVVEFKASDDTVLRRLQVIEEPEAHKKCSLLSIMQEHASDTSQRRKRASCTRPQKD